MAEVSAQASGHLVAKPQVEAPQRVVKRSKYFCLEVKPTTTASQLLNAFGVYRSYPVTKVTVTVKSLGTAAHVYLGDNTFQSVDLDAAGEYKEFSAYGRSFDISDIFVKVDTGTTTVLIVEGFQE